MLSVSLLRILMTRSLKPFLFEGRYRNNLDFVSADDLGLYVHIPFCRSLCSFCPYCKVLYDRQKAADFKQALLQEIDLVCRGMDSKKQVTSLYFGGGTPALMINDLAAIIEKLRGHFTIAGGIGVELHPNDLTPEILRKLKAAGVTMVSIGVQSFLDECLLRIGRRNEGIYDKLQLVREAGFDVIDIDLIFAIPGQTDRILTDDITAAFEHGATQVSAYPFIDFTFADNLYKPMSKNFKKKMLIHLAEYCRSIGIVRTSVWTFAKPGTARYSSVTRDSFLGFGVSATTLLKDCFKINTFSIEAYIERIRAGLLATSLTLDFTKRQRAAYFLFWSAYAMRIDSGKFEKLIGIPIREMYGFELSAAEKMGFIKKDGANYELTDKASVLYHYIEQAYTTAYIDKMWNISGKQAFPKQIVLK